MTPALRLDGVVHRFGATLALDGARQAGAETLGMATEKFEAAAPGVSAPETASTPEAPVPPSP